MKKFGVIIPAGGSGTRMGAGSPKQFALLAGEPVMAHAIKAFRAIDRDADIVAALPAAHIDGWKKLCDAYDVPPHKICEGGPTRTESVRRALEVLDPACEYIAVHDAVRPLVSGALIISTLETARRHGTAIPAVEIADSIRRVKDADISHPEDRANLRAVQTPQVFRADILRTAYERVPAYEGVSVHESAPVAGSESNFTDDASVVEAAGYTVHLTPGERRNIKITLPDDLAIAAAILEAKNQ